MKTSFSSLTFLAAVAVVAVVPSATTGFVVPTVVASTSTSTSSSTSSLNVAAEAAAPSKKLISPPKNIADLKDTSEELYDDNVQSTYG